MSYVTTDGESEPVFTRVRIGPGIRRATLAPGGGRSDSITMESPRPESASAPDDDVHFDGGVVAFSPNTPGQRRARGHSPYFQDPVTDYSLPEDYVEPFYGAAAQRQRNYGPGLNARGYINDQAGLLQLPDYGLGFDFSSAASDATAAAERGAMSTQAKAAPAGDSVLSVLKGIIPSIVQGGASVFNTVQQGKTAIKQAKLSMAGETNDSMAPTPPAPASIVPSWLLPAGAAAVGLAVLWKMLR